MIEVVFGGFGNIYGLHRLAGKTVFYLIMAHPILLGMSGFMRGRGIADVFNWTSALIIVGIIGLSGLIVATAVTIYAHIKHQRWIMVHRLFGWLIPVFLAHALLARSQIVQNRALFVYMIVLATMGFLAFLYRSVMTRFIKRYAYVVSEVNHPSTEVTELVLKPVGPSMNYKPGQFAYLSLESDVVDDEAHPFSFTTAPNGPYVRFVIKALGDDTEKLFGVMPGTKAYLEGPHGKFSHLNSKNPKQVWVAGGVGITPFLSMARSLRPNDKYDVHLFYAAEELKDAVFLREILSISKQAPNFKLSLVDRRFSGFVSADMIGETVQNLQEYDFFICGPPGMMQALKSQLNAKGVPADRVHTEEFSMNDR